MGKSPISASFKQGTMLKMTVLLGFVLGFVAYAYDWCMRSSLWFVWGFIPAALERGIRGRADGEEILERFGFLYIIFTTLVLGVVVGLCVKCMGNPGDLADAVKCIHKLGYVPMAQTLPMIFVSLFSIASGASLGPEAPLVGISSSLSSWISMRYFKHPPPMVRKCALIGMSAGLSAFFGVQLGGALFTLEVCHTMGLQFFDVSMYAISAGGICMLIFRGLRGESFGRLWHFPEIPQSGSPELLLGIVLGFVAAWIGLFFVSLHRTIAKCLHAVGLGNFEDTQRPVVLAALGGLFVAMIGIIFPPTMFWSEFEIEALAVPGTRLHNVWPQGGLFYGMDIFPWDSAPMYLAVGFAKLLSISISVHSGFRGGFIFPLFLAGGSIGRAIYVLLPQWLNEYVQVTPVLICMCMASGLNTAITRTPLATPLILTALCGCPDVAAPVLSAALVALFVTRNSIFIPTQKDRTDLQYVDNLFVPEMNPYVKTVTEGVKAIPEGVDSGGERTQLVGHNGASVSYDAAVV